MSLIRTASLLIVLLAFHCGEASALATGRSNAATVLLPSGDLMVIGGAVDPLPNTRTNTTEIFFTSASAWGTGLPMTVARSSHTATVLSDGRVLVAGGFNSGGVPLQSAEIYNPATKLWAVMDGVAACTAKMCFARGGHTATLIGRGTNKGKVLICGGQYANSGVFVSSTCETFNPTAAVPGLFEQAPPMNSQRMGHTASATNKGTVFVSGGRTWDTSVTPSTWVYLPTNEIYDGSFTWTPVTSLNQGRAFHVATALNTGNIMIAGGYAGGTSSATIFDTPEESWHSTDDGLEQQGGSHGYLGTAEIFDPNGGRVQIAGKDFITMPYRANRQAALLMPDGTNHIHGGYGNLVPKFVSGSPVFERNVRLYITRTSVNTATVDTDNELKFELKTQLARNVDGRIVDGDFFISQPIKGGDPFSANEQQRGDPAITSDNMKVWLVKSTAPLDGSPVGAMIDNGKPGEFKDTIWPRYNSVIPGTVKFDNQTVTSKNASITTSRLAWTTNGGEVHPTTTMTGVTKVGLLSTISSITANVNFTIPAIYVGGTFVGTATIKSENPATITPEVQSWTASITGGTGDINTTVGEDADTKLGLIAVPVYFHDVAGIITNLTAYTTYTSPQDGTGSYMTGLSLYISFTVDGVKLERLTYSMSVSTVVIRGMMFSDYLVYTPKDSNWAFGSPLNVPLIGHNTILTPGADSYLVGGEHCEDLDGDGSPDPYADCTRAGVANDANITNPYDIYDTKVDWASAVKLTTRRAFHTSTLLPDGYILTCGGSDGSATLSNCEHVNTAQTAPLSQKLWVFASSMTSARSRHTATLLPNGYVLAAGGTTGASTAAINTAEIYYPATKRWVRTTLPMNTARQNHTATLLPDGKVLVAGGSSTGAYASTSEIFNTTAAIWNSAGNLFYAGGRAQHTATLLKNGKVLAAGGVNGAGPLKTTEIYNSVTQTWSAGPSLNTSRYSHTASLLKDGRVVITGGSDNYQSQKTAEVYDGVSWKYVQIQGEGGMEEAAMNLARSNHRTVLLPNGKLMITGGEAAGVSQSKAEGFDVDLSSFQYQGRMEPRANHTTVLTPDNRLMNIGGWDGAKCLDTTETLYFSFAPDSAGVDPKTRNPVISTGTTYFDRGQQITLLSATTNFHGMTEASGGGAGPANSSFSNPRIYLQAIDNPSGFLTDLTTRLYTIYGSSNTDWETTLSSITITMSTVPAEVPYGWYHVRVAANGMFSEGRTVQATIPRPAGHIIGLAGQVTGSTSVYWTWNADTAMNANVPLPDGYGIFSSSDGVFLTTVAYTSPPLPVGEGAFTQTNLVPNTRISVKIGAYNTGGYGELIESPTYYTWAVTPQSLTVQRASFESVTLSWDPAGNSSETPYEITVVDQANPGTTLTPMPFANNFTSTFTTVFMLSPNRYYDFRVQAKNGAGILTGYSLPVTTITVDNIANLKGTALTVSQINWAWDPSDGDPGYEIYGVTGQKVTDVVFLGSTTYVNENNRGNAYTQSDVVGTALSTNTAYGVRVNAFKNYYGPVRGPYAVSKKVFTLAAKPGIGVSAISSISTGSVLLSWVANGNPPTSVNLSSTSYVVDGAMEATPGVKLTTFTVTIMDTRLSLSKLLPNTSYSFQVSAVNGDGISSDILNLGSVYTHAQSPIRVQPSAITMSGVTLTWDPGENPLLTIYEVRGSTASLITGPFMFPTPQPFSAYRTATSFSMTGLLTSTTYYFDVAARNRAATPVVTGRTQSVPAAFTLAGPNGAPSGSVGGTSDPARNVTIEGTLPNNRFVSLYVPSGAFASQTAIAISSWSPGPPIITSPCGRSAEYPNGYQIGAPVHPLEVAIYSDGGAQPQVPVTITLKYDGESPGETHESTRIGLDIAKLVLTRYNPVSDSCLPLETMINTGLRTITATLDHFSVFQLMLKTAASNLSAVRVFPNPLYINRGPNLLTIDNLPASAKVRIYTLSGDKVWEGTASSTGDIHWRGVNSAGVTVGSGIYLAVIDSSAGKKVVKIAVER